MSIVINTRIESVELDREVTSEDVNEFKKLVDHALTTDGIGSDEPNYYLVISEGKATPLPLWGGDFSFYRGEEIRALLTEKGYRAVTNCSGCLGRIEEPDWFHIQNGDILCAACYGEHVMTLQKYGTMDEEEIRIRFGE